MVFVWIELTTSHVVAILAMLVDFVMSRLMSVKSIHVSMEVLAKNCVTGMDTSATANLVPMERTVKSM